MVKIAPIAVLVLALALGGCSMSSKGDAAAPGGKACVCSKCADCSKCSKGDCQCGESGSCGCSEKKEKASCGAGESCGCSGKK
jgi:hypothetical protein